MKMNKYVALAAGVMLASGFVSCSDKDPDDVIYQYPFNECYAVISNVDGSGTPEIIDGVLVTAYADVTTQTGQMLIGGLKTNGQSMSIMTFEEVPWTQKNSWNSMNKATKVTLATGVVAPVTNMMFEWNDRNALLDFTKEYSPAMQFSFEYNNSLYITGGSLPLYLGGTTTSTPQGGTGYTSNTSLYQIDINVEAKTAVLKIYGAAFAQGMPALNMAFSGINFTCNRDGSIILACDALTPTIGDVPQPNYPISNLSGIFTPGRGASVLEFTCTFRGMPFNVKAELTTSDIENFVNNNE